MPRRQTYRIDVGDDADVADVLDARIMVGMLARVAPDARAEPADAVLPGRSGGFQHQQAQQPARAADGRSRRHPRDRDSQNADTAQLQSGDADGNWLCMPDSKAESSLVDKHAMHLSSENHLALSSARDTALLFVWGVVFPLGFWKASQGPCTPRRQRQAWRQGYRFQGSCGARLPEQAVMRSSAAPQTEPSTQEPIAREIQRHSGRPDTFNRRRRNCDSTGSQLLGAQFPRPPRHRVRRSRCRRRPWTTAHR